jgi:hypothetical protein
MGTASLIKVLCGKSTYVFDSTHCVNEQFHVQQYMVSIMTVESLLVFNEQLKTAKCGRFILLNYIPFNYHLKTNFSMYFQMPAALH